MSQINLSYEILRREDGMIALSVNAGRFSAKPLALELDAADGLVRSGRGDMIARFANLPDDLISYARESGGIEIYEFGTFGMLGQHELAWRGTP